MTESLPKDNIKNLICKEQIDKIKHKFIRKKYSASMREFTTAKRSMMETFDSAVKTGISTSYLDQVEFSGKI